MDRMYFLGEHLEMLACDAYKTLSYGSGPKWQSLSQTERHLWREVVMFLTDSILRIQAEAEKQKVLTGGTVPCRD